MIANAVIEANQGAEALAPAEAPAASEATDMEEVVAAAEEPATEATEEKAE